MSTKAQWEEARAAADRLYDAWAEAREQAARNPKNHILAMEAVRAGKRFDEAARKAKDIRLAWLNPSNPEPNPAA